jgi:ribokinase
VTAAPEPTTADKAPGAEAPAVIVVGSLHYDIMVDAPGRPRKGETLAGRSWTPKFGGKGGNQAVAARRQRVSTAMVGAVGKDSFGEALLASLDRAKVDRRGVAVFDGFGSGMSVAIFDDEGDYGAVIVSGANLAITPDQVSDELLARGKVLVVQNEIPELVNEAVARRARERGLTIIINAAPARAFVTGLPHLIDVLVVNAIEAEMLGGGWVSSLEPPLRPPPR